MRRAPGTGCVYRPTYRGADDQSRRSRLYRIAYRVGNHTKWEAAKTANRQDAERLLRKRLAALDRGDLPATDRATWDDLAEMIQADYRAQGRRSTARLELSLRHLEKSFGGLRAATITTERVNAHVARRLEEDGAARATVNRELAALKRAFRLAHRTGRVLLVPYVALLKEGNARTGFFERPDFERLVDELPADLRPLAVTAYVTGWRVPSELLTREWRHVDLRRGWLRLEPGETKSGRGRMFPLTPELRAALRAQRKATDLAERRVGRLIAHVFHHEGLPLVYRGAGGWLVAPYLRRSWGVAVKAVGLSGRILHDFRRTATRDLLRSGVPQHVVMAALGWETQAMLQRYAIVSEPDLVEAGRKRARLRQ